MAVQGERIGAGFILVTGLDGIRYAMRPQSVGIIHGADECGDETMIQLHGGHVFGSRARLTKFWRGSPDNQGSRPDDIARRFVPHAHSRDPVRVFGAGANSFARRCA
jgi:hypothetical protein